MALNVNTFFSCFVRHLGNVHMFSSHMPFEVITEFDCITKKDFALGISLLLPKQQLRAAYSFLNGVGIIDKNLG